MARKHVQRSLCKVALFAKSLEFLDTFICIFQEKKQLVGQDFHSFVFLTLLSGTRDEKILGKSLGEAASYVDSRWHRTELHWKSPGWVSLL